MEHRRWDYSSYMPRVQYQSEADRILKKVEASFKALLLQSQIRENGETEEENSAEFEKRFKKNEGIVMSSLSTLIRNPACISHKPYSQVIKKIYEHRENLPGLYHQTESWLITFINPQFEEYFKFRINKTSFYNIFPSETLSFALDNFNTDF